MINELLNKINSSDQNTLETESLAIKNNALIMENTIIQISNISMISRNKFKSPVTVQDILIIVGTAIFGIAFLPLFIVTILYSLYVYSKHKQYKQTKYYITFNLGSSNNYHLYFEDNTFRNQVYDTVKKSLNQKNQNIYIDLKNNNIENQTVFENGSQQTNITGDQNMVGNTIDNSNVTTSGNITSDSNIIKNSPNATQSIVTETSSELPWESISNEIQTLINQNILSQEINQVLKRLDAAAKEQNQKGFSKIVKDNRNLISNNIVQNIISGTLSGIFTAILTNSL